MTKRTSPSAEYPNIVWILQIRFLGVTYDSATLYAECVGSLEFEELDCSQTIFLQLEVLKVKDFCE